MDGLRSKISSLVRIIVLAAAGAAAATAALLFLSVAAFLWLQQRYDSIVACLALGAGYFLLMLLAFLVVYARSKQETAKPAARGEEESPFVASMVSGFRKLGTKKALASKWVPRAQSRRGRKVS